MPSVLKKKLKRKTCVFRVYVMQVCEVLGGRNWVQDTDENKPPFLRDGTEGGNRLDQLPLEDVLEKAERVIEVRFFFPFLSQPRTESRTRYRSARLRFFFSFFHCFLLFSPLLFFSLSRRDSLYTEKCCDESPQRDSVKNKESAKECV